LNLKELKSIKNQVIIKLKKLNINYERIGIGVDEKEPYILVGFKKRIPKNLPQMENNIKIKPRIVEEVFFL